MNKFFGAIFGAAKTFLVVAILLYFLDGIDNKVNFIDEKKKDESMLYPPLLELMERVVPEIDLQKIKKSLPEFDMEEFDKKKEAVDSLLQVKI